MREPPSRFANPFATCWTRTGALPWCATDSVDPPSVVAALKAADWRGQLVGPHGVGKSSLLEALIPPLRVHGKQPVLCSDASAAPATGTLLIDGFERLAPTDAQALISRWSNECRSFVLTTHRPIDGVAVVARLTPNQRLLGSLFGWLTRSAETPVTIADAQASLVRHDGNLREVWFDLYDLHDRLTRPDRTAPVTATYQTPAREASSARGPADRRSPTSVH